MKKKPRRAANRPSKAPAQGPDPAPRKLLPFEDLIEKIFKVDRTVGIFSHRR